ncbi:MAG: heavy metal transporter [Acidimicrobiia bacterium]|nr:heavy metal transporter [Acidimicrobiia bacterium]
MMTTTQYRVTGMTCDHCEQAVSTEVRQIAGVENVAVSASTGLLIVVSDGAADEAAVLAAVDEAGYSAASLT